MLVGGSKPRALSTEPHSFLALPSSVKYLDPHKLEVMGAEAKAVLSAHLSLNWNHCPGHSLPREKAEGITLPNRKHSNITQTAQQPWSYILTQTPAGHNTEEGSIQEAKMIGETDRDRARRQPRAETSQSGAHASSVYWDRRRYRRVSLLSDRPLHNTNCHAGGPGPPQGSDHSP